MMAILQRDARAALRLMTVAQIRAGLRAFSCGPRLHVARCFVGFAFADGLPGQFNTVVCMAHAGKLLPLTTDHTATLSMAFESDLRDWLYGECLRELAERGEAVEVAPAAAVST